VNVTAIDWKFWFITKFAAPSIFPEFGVTVILLVPACPVQSFIKYVSPVGGEPGRFAAIAFDVGSRQRK
jgi:hypothetical protein